LLLALAAAPFLVVLLAGPASAHATLLFATPAADGSVPEAPGTLTLVFDEPVSTGDSPLRLTGPDGQDIGLGKAALSGKRTIVDVPLSQTLSTGAYTVDWQVSSNDGDTVAGRYRFAVGPSLAGVLSTSASGTAASTPGLTATVVARWLMYTALSVALGGLVMQSLLQRRIPSIPSTRDGAPQPWLLPAAVLGAAGAYVTALLVEGNGSLLRGLTGFSVGRLTDTRPGTMALIEVDAFVLAALLAVTRRRSWAVVPLGAVVVAEGLRGHLNAAVPGWGAAVATVHFLAAAVWVGGLVQAVRTAWGWRAEPGRARLAVVEYARAALWLVAVVVGTGTVAALVLVPVDELVSTGYGRILLVKIALVVLSLGLALTARNRLRTPISSAATPAVPMDGPPTPLLDDSHSVTAQAVLTHQPPVSQEDSPARLLSVTWAETAVLAAVLAISAVLTGFSPPPRGDTDLPYAPPASGTGRSARGPG
jgi:copper transport protein